MLVVLVVMDEVLVLVLNVMMLVLVLVLVLLDVVVDVWWWMWWIARIFLTRRRPNTPRQCAWILATMRGMAWQREVWY